MAKDKELEEELKKLNEKSIKASKEQLKSSVDQQKAQEKIAETVRDISDASKKLLDIKRDIFDVTKQLSSEELKRLEMQRDSLKDDLAALKNDKAQLLASAKHSKEISNAAKKTREIAKIEALALPHKKKLIEAQAKINKIQDKSSSIAKKSLGIFDILDSKIKSIPIVGDVISKSLGLDTIQKELSDKFSGFVTKALNPTAVKQKKMAEDALKGYNSQIDKLRGVKDAASDVTESVSETGAAMESVSSSTTGILGRLGMMGGLVAGIGIAALAIAKKFSDIRDESIDIARTQGITSSEAKKQLSYINNVVSQSTKYGIALAGMKTEMIALNNAFRDTFKTSNQLTATNIQMSAYLMKNMGLTNEQASQFLESTALTGMSMDRNVVLLEESVDRINDATHAGLRYGDVAKELASTSETVLANYKNSIPAITLATRLAQKYRTTLSAMEKSSRSLLNIEESLSDEMEARVLTGLDLNYDQARSLALSGKSAEAMDMILKKAGSYNNVLNMSVLARESLAKSMNMETDEMLKQLKNQEVMKSLTAIQVKDLDSISVKAIKGGDAIVKSMDKQAVEQYLANRAQAKASELQSSAMGKLSALVDQIAVGGLQSLEKGNSGLSERLDEAGLSNTAAESVDDALIRPGLPPIKFDKNDLILAGTGIMNTNQTNGVGSSMLESLLKELIAKIDQPVIVKIGDRTVEELNSQMSLKRSYSTVTDRSYGAYR